MSVIRIEIVKDGQKTNIILLSLLVYQVRNGNKYRLQSLSLPFYTLVEEQGYNNVLPKGVSGLGFTIRLAGL